ncbi:MAG: LysR family transcriptional regulator, partial [Clostridiales Family XIII bacterium]|jgi:DNA-binding transcriptional LysR family regulator|nr:LysR family transcriptional regulator [Clostridiales Family XIII bacterium]
MLGVRLFKRTHSEVSLTEAGEYFLDQALELLEKTKSMISTTKGFAQEKAGWSGRISVAFDNKLNYWDFYFSRIPSVLQKAVGDRKPFVDCQFMELNAIIKSMKKGLVDVGLTVHFHPPGLRETRFLNLIKFARRQVLWVNTLALLVPKKYDKLNLAMASDVDAVSELDFLVLVNDSTFLAERVGYLANANIFTSVRFCDDWSDMKARISLGEGFCMISTIAARMETNDDIGLLSLDETDARLDAEMVVFWKDHGKGDIDSIIHAFADGSQEGICMDFL